MTKLELIEAINKGANTANSLYEKWSGGHWITDYGVEGFMVSEICRSIQKTRNSGYLSMEESFESLIDCSGERPIGRPPEAISGAKRVDIALWNTRSEVTHVLEVKRGWETECRKDLSRLYELQRKLQTIQRGIFVMYEVVEGDQECLQKRMDKHANMISDHLGDGTHEFYYDAASKYSYSSGEYLGGCLCVDIYGNSDS